MKLREVAGLIHAQVLTDEEMLDREVDNVFCTDVMADVLAFAASQTVLITRLINLSVVRSAVMVDVHCIVFSDGKMPPKEILALAEINDLVVMTTEDTMFHATSTLMEAGLTDVEW